MSGSLFFMPEEPKSNGLITGDQPRKECSSPPGLAPPPRPRVIPSPFLRTTSGGDIEDTLQEKVEGLWTCLPSTSLPDAVGE